MFFWGNKFISTLGAKHRVANIRKHQLLKPEIKMMTTAIDSITPSAYVFEYLEIENEDMQATNIQLGFPANVVHVVRWVAAMS